MSRPPRPWSPGSLLRLVSDRAWNIAFRTAHIAAMGILLGGHVFAETPEQRLLVSLYFTVGTGIALALSEAGPSWLWFHQLRGLMTMGKIVLACGVPLFWTLRVPILLGVVVIASVGSHMPARFRYYSVLYRQVIRGGCGPGAGQLEADQDT
jgi:hypothetical protein